MEIDLKLLRCFEMLMTERNVSRAAARLRLSQPAMSSALARLRVIFEDALLLRNKGEMLPTDRAIELQAEVRKILESTERLVSKPSAFDPANSRIRFSIMAAEAVEHLLAAPLMEQLGQAPGIDVEFVPADRQRAQRMLEHGEIDFRLGWWPNAAPMLRHKALFRDRLVCLARKGHPEIRNRITLQQFLQTPHIRIRTPELAPSVQAIDDAVSALDRKLRIALRTQGISALSNVVSQSNFIASVPESLGRRLAKEHPLQVLASPLPIPDMRITLYWHERAHNQPGHRWFRQLLTDVARVV